MIELEGVNKDPLGGRVLHELFGQYKPIIGTIHLVPLPGSPRYSGASMREVVEPAVTDALAYIEGNVDGLIVENEGDIPFLKPGDIGPETVAAMTAVCVAVRDAVDVPMGVLCLANATVESLAIAKASGGTFVRANQWANAYIANEGFVEGAAAKALRYRSMIRAPEVKVLADVHVKHGSHAIVADRGIDELTRDTEAFDADVLIATGQRTGDATTVDEVMQIKSAATRPVLVGSGLNTQNAATLLSRADGAIVGSAMKESGHWQNPVAVDRVKAIMHEVETVR